MGNERLPRLFDAALWRGCAVLGRGLGLDERTGAEETRGLQAAGPQTSGAEPIPHPPWTLTLALILFQIPNDRLRKVLLRT